jgi:hypothetical protein
MPRSVSLFALIFTTTFRSIVSLIRTVELCFTTMRATRMLLHGQGTINSIIRAFRGRSKPLIS